MAISLRVDQTLPLSIAFADAHGNPIPTPPPLDGPPVWTVSDGAVATVAASADGLTAVVTPATEGAVSISIVVMIGGVSFNAAVDITVTAAAVPAVASVSIVVGVPVPA